MKRILITFYGKFIATILTSIGIIVTSCVEYGSPHANYIIKGKVTDQETQKAIGNISVIHKTSRSPYGNDTVKTNEKGEYRITKDFAFDNEFMIYAEDLDGEANGGLYEKDSIKVRLSEMKQTKKGDGRWFDGIFEKKDADFTLSKQVMAPEYGIRPTSFKKIDQK